jgi:hypothetical protein
MRQNLEEGIRLHKPVSYLHYEALALPEDTLCNDIALGLTTGVQLRGSPVGALAVTTSKGFLNNSPVTTIVSAINCIVFLNQYITETLACIEEDINNFQPRFRQDFFNS